MSFKHTLEVLNSQTKEILQITEELKDSGEVRLIDIHLLLDKLRNIYDLAVDLESTVPQSKIETKQETENPDVAEESVDVKEEEPAFELNETETEEVVTESKEVITPQEPKEEALENSRFVSDRFKSSEKILNEEMSGTSKKEDITGQYMSSPISNITSAMGLNEKFEIINELFEGDKAKFDKVMEVLNMAGSFVEAYNYLEANFDWDMDNAYVLRLLELIRRKLIVHRNGE